MTLPSTTRDHAVSRAVLIGGLILVIGAVVFFWTQFSEPVHDDEYADLVIHLRADRDASGLIVRDDSRYEHVLHLSGGSAALRGDADVVMTFDGVDDALTVMYDPILSPSDAMTLMAWVYLEPGDSQASIVEQAGAVSDAIDAYRLEAQFTEPAGYVFIMHDRRGERFEIRSTPTQEPMTQRWTHIAVTISSDSLRWFRDGQWLSETRMHASAGAVMESTGLLRVGSSTHAVVPPFRGMIDDVRVYRRTLSGAEVECAYLQKVWVDGACEDVGKNNRKPVVFDVRGPGPSLIANSDAWWRVTTFDPDRDAVTSVADWGDSTRSSSSSSSRAARFTHSLTHRYTTEGVYTPTFTVHDGAGAAVTIAAPPVVVERDESHVEGSSADVR